MINKIEILSPGQNCRKTERIIKSMKRFLKENNIEAEYKIISKREEFLKYRTWLLPTIIINDKIVARGYRPSNKKVLKYLSIE